MQAGGCCSTCVPACPTVLLCSTDLPSNAFLKQVQDPRAACAAPRQCCSRRILSVAGCCVPTVPPCSVAPQVQDPAEAAPFLPQLAPLLERVANEAADPELREVRGCLRCCSAWDWVGVECGKQGG